jgi:hypothetical protein
MAGDPKLLRCAIYTRKSTEHGAAQSELSVSVESAKVICRCSGPTSSCPLHPNHRTLSARSVTSEKCPQPDPCTAATLLHSITLSAPAKSIAGTSRPRVFAVFG